MLGKLYRTGIFQLKISFIVLASNLHPVGYGVEHVEIPAQCGLKMYVLHV
jgi:hypothetical protein